MVAGLEIGVGGDPGQQFIQPDLPGIVLGGAVDAAQAQQLADQCIQPMGLPLDPVQGRGCGGTGLLPGQFQGNAEAGQGRAQFVGNIPQQPLVTFDQGLDPFGHTVEIDGEGADVIPAADLLPNPGGEIASGKALGGSPQTGQRGTQGAGQKPGDQPGDHKCGQQPRGQAVGVEQLFQGRRVATAARSRPRPPGFLATRGKTSTQKRPPGKPGGRFCVARQPCP